MHNGKIKVIHMEINGEHYYFGSLKVMCQYFGRDKLGMSYNSLRANVRLTPENPFHHETPSKRTRKKSDGTNVSQLDLFG